MDIKQDDARQRLLDAALKIFMTKGYAAASVSEIVQAAGVTKPMLYYYFKNKEGIYTELMMLSFREFDAMLARYSEPVSPIKDTLMNMFKELMMLQDERMDYVRLIYAMVYGPAQGAPAVDFEVFHTRMAARIAEMVQVGIERGEFEEVDVADFSTLLISVLFFCMDSRVIDCAVTMSAEDMSRIIGKVFSKILIK